MVCSTCRVESNYSVIGIPDRVCPKAKSRGERGEAIYYNGSPPPPLFPSVVHRVTPLIVIRSFFTIIITRRRRRHHHHHRAGEAAIYGYGRDILFPLFIEAQPTSVRRSVVERGNPPERPIHFSAAALSPPPPPSAAAFLSALTSERRLP